MADIVEKGEGAIALSPINIDSNCLTYEKDNTYISTYKYEESPEIKIFAGDIIFVKTGSTVGKVAFVDNIIDRTTLNPQLVVLKQVKCNPYFLYLLMAAPCFQKHIKRITVGGAVPTLSQNEMGRIRITLPPNAEQDRISALFKLLNYRIETQKKIIEKYESLIRGIVETHYSQCECIKQVRISELGEPFTTMNISKEDLSEEGNECILYGELFTTYGCVIKEVKSRTHISTDKATISRSNDLLFPASTTVDAMSLIAPSAICKEGVILGGDLFGVHVNKDYNNEYLSYLINYIYKSKLARYAQGSTIIHLYYSDIKKAKLLLPTIEEQNYLAYLMRGVEEKFNIEKDMLSQLYRQKAYLLSNLFI